MSYYYNINSRQSTFTDSNVTNRVTIGSSYTGSIFCSSTGLSFNNNIVPTSNNLNLGSLEQPWKSLYVSTGTVFIGPTGTLLINSNGLISSTEGFASPYFQVGAINPGQGIILYEQNNLLWFQNQSGATGPISIFNVASNSINNTFFTGGNIGVGLDNPTYALDVAGTIRATTFTGTNAHFSNLTATTYTGTNVYITNINSTGGNFDSLSTVSLTGSNAYFTTINTINLNEQNVFANNFTGGSGTFHNLNVQDTLNIGSTNVGQIYFSTGNYTGCFISNLRYNATGDHYIYYNSRNKELVQVSPIYFFSYNTTTQIFTGPNIFYPVGFNTNNILYHTFQHTTGSSIFTGTFGGDVTLEFTYSLQLHATSNNTHIGAAVLYLDGNPIPGSYRSASVTDTGGEYCLTNTLLVTIPAGGHTIELRAAVDNTNLQLGGTPTITPPGNSYSSVNLKCSRII